MSAASRETPKVVAWLAALGLFERYTYPAAVAGRDHTHVHADVQVCLSENFPGRYRSGRWMVNVPAGAVSIVDAWEPHAAEDPIDRAWAARYRVVYISKARWDHAAAEIGHEPRVGIMVHRRPGISNAVAVLHRRAEDGASALEQDERFGALMVALLQRPRRARPLRELTPRHADLDRAREFVRAHALRGVTLAEAAREAGLSPQHFSTSFRARYGLPVHRFQILMRLDHAKRLLALGEAPIDVAAACGLSDQSHLIRHFKRHLGLTPGRYRAASTLSRTFAP
jgi:AraC-like DNA-binding protein